MLHMQTTESEKPTIHKTQPTNLLSRYIPTVKVSLTKTQLTCTPVRPDHPTDVVTNILPTFMSVKVSLDTVPLACACRRRSSKDNVCNDGTVFLSSIFPLILFVFCLRHYWNFVSKSKPSCWIRVEIFRFVQSLKWKKLWTWNQKQFQVLYKEIREKKNVIKHETIWNWSVKRSVSVHQIRVFCFSFPFDWIV